MSALLKEMQIDVQSMWQSKRQPNTHNDMQVSFWALPREADISALVSVISRVHGKHTLFGGPICVHGPNSPQLQRCTECREIGHAQNDCPLFGGTAVRLVFKKPLNPAAFADLQHAREARSIGDAWQCHLARSLVCSTQSNPVLPLLACRAETVVARPVGSR